VRTRDQFIKAIAVTSLGVLVYIHDQIGNKKLSLDAQYFACITKVRWFNKQQKMSIYKGARMNLGALLKDAVHSQLN